jgi:hypothetical protein
MLPPRFTVDSAAVRFATGGTLMRRLACLVIALSLAACGGGSKSGPSLSVVCSGAGGVQLVGATSIDVLGDPQNGRPTLTYPDPVNAGKTGSISVPPLNQCRITPTAPS